MDDYTPALGLYDRLAAWQMADDERARRWIGISLYSGIRGVRAIENAPADTFITCNLELDNGAEAVAGELGYNIKVYADICGGGNLDSAVPRIAEGDWLSAYNVQGTWWFATPFQPSEDCECYTS